VSHEREVFPPMNVILRTSWMRMRLSVGSRGPSAGSSHEPLAGYAADRDASASSSMSSSAAQPEPCSG
jgi:hypothetical protein